AAARGRRGRSVPPGVEARGRNLQPGAHLHDRVVFLFRVDERVFLAHRYSWAKKAAAFPRNSVFIRNSRFSRSSSRSRARSGRVNGGSSPACSTRYLLTQLPSVPSCTPISRATSAIGREVSTTSRTASDLNSGVNFRRFSRIDVPPFRPGPYWVRYPKCGRHATPQAASVKSRGGERCGKSPAGSGAGGRREGERV